MRLDYDFNGKSGYAFAARALSFTAPANYEIRFWVRGAGPSNTFEVKFTDGERPRTCTGARRRATSSPTAGPSS
jgi:hypothetical protein